MKFLIIEDEAEIVGIINIVINMRWAESTVITTIYGEKGIELARKESPDAIILDLGLPDIDGFQVLEQIRAFSDVPIIILTVRGDEIYRVQGLELGADDYLVKPFSPAELLARLKAITRRKQKVETIDTEKTKPFIKGKLRVDFYSKEISIGDKLIQIGPREFELLNYLVVNAGKVISNKILLNKIFAFEETGSIDYLRLIIKNLKKKIEIDSGNPTMIVNVDDKGYKFINM